MAYPNTPEGAARMSETLAATTPVAQLDFGSRLGLIISQIDNQGDLQAARASLFDMLRTYEAGASQVFEGSVISPDHEALL